MNLYSYADALQLITTELHQILHALDLITSSCKTLGLKASAIHTGPSRPHDHRPSQGWNIKWTGNAKYLGHIFSSCYHQNGKLAHLKKYIQFGIHAMKKLTSTKTGTGFRILRTFYVQAVQSIIDFTSQSIIDLISNLLAKLETFQNKAMQAIPDALH